MLQDPCQRYHYSRGVSILLINPCILIVSYNLCIILCTTKIWLIADTSKHTFVNFPGCFWWKINLVFADFMTGSHFNIFPLVYKVFPNTCMGLYFEHTHSSVLLWLYLHNQESENQGWKLKQIKRHLYPKDMGDHNIMLCLFFPFITTAHF